ncbi:MAG: Rieske 2Fe-2S domain-containing protein [Gammaproteobacteria bacterium]|nr:Rieske 2Fe-2S domain-containing protein [Gammaproteobacteria bacterium]
MSEAIDLQDARTAPALVWQQLDQLKGDALLEWRMAPIENGRPAAERNIAGLPMPFGWFALCYADELAVGEVKPLRYFERELVLWRGEDGTARLLDAYCPHLGAHMGYGGKVDGQHLQCPFHSWRWDGEGRAVAIPYSKSIPPKMKRPACERSYPTAEVNGFVWAWWHPEQVAPLYELQAFEEVGHPDWTDYEKHEWIVHGPMQALAENGADSAHFKYVHGVVDNPDYDIRYEGHRRTAEVRVRMGTPRGLVDGAIAYGVDGAGQPWTRFTGICETLLVTGVTPIARDVTHLRFAFTQLKADRDGPNRGVAKAVIRDICKQLDQDKVIWDRQAYVDQAPLCAGDGPINDFRNFFRQFYAGPQWEKYRDAAQRSAVTLSLE